MDVYRSMWKGLILAGCKYSSLELKLDMYKAYKKSQATRTFNTYINWEFK